VDGRLVAGDHPGALPDPWLAEIPGGRKCGQWMVGIGIGLHFTPLVIEQVLSHFGLIFFGALVTSLSAWSACG
jgi:uncharacterized membrane protein AbrB (regulator of aidB expression)